jgi:hypothetical protein
VPEPDATDAEHRVPPAVERRIRIAVWGLAGTGCLTASLALPWASADGGYLLLWGIKGGHGTPYGGLALLILMLLLPAGVAAIAEARRGLSSFAAAVGGLALLAELALYYGLAGSDGLGAEPALLVGTVATATLVGVHLYTALTAGRQTVRRTWTRRPVEDARSRAERIRHLGH